MKTERSERQKAQMMAQKYQDTRLKISELEQNHKFQLIALAEAETNLNEIAVQIKNLQAQKPQPEDVQHIAQLQQDLTNFKKQYQYLLQLQILITHREQEQKQLQEKFHSFLLQALYLQFH